MKFVAYVGMNEYLHIKSESLAKICIIVAEIQKFF